MSANTPTRIDGTAPLSEYGAIGDGRSVALVAADGSIDWWAQPAMDSPPFFDRLLDSHEGGYYCIAPTEDFTFERRYLPGSNVLETTYTTASGSVRLTESLNSGTAGRLPWSELARRVEGVDGTVAMSMRFVPGSRFKTATPWIEKNEHGQLLHLDGVTAMLRHDEDVDCTIDNDRCLHAEFEAKAGDRHTFGLLSTFNEPLVVADLQTIDERIDISDKEWRVWSDALDIDFPYPEAVKRSALALKLLLYSPTGALSAAATTSLPEGENGDGNYDYRFAWVRDAAYMIKALMRVGASQESQAAFAWLLNVIHEHGPQLRAFYTLDGALPDESYEAEMPGYNGIGPVRVGNSARRQRQLSMYGDVMETAALFVNKGNLLDVKTGRLLANLADQCADEWQLRDSGIWELFDLQHYTMSKIGCWLALQRATELAEGNHIDATHVDRWRRERDRIAEWIDEHCWSESKQAYTQYAGTDKLDAALLLATRFGFPRKDRLLSTMHAVVEELSCDGPLLYRYTGSSEREGAFLACSFWLVEARAMLGFPEDAQNTMEQLLKITGGETYVMTEMIDPKTGLSWGNVPQGLSHLALIHAADALADAGIK